MAVEISSAWPALSYGTFCHKQVRVRLQFAATSLTFTDVSMTGLSLTIDRSAAPAKAHRAVGGGAFSNGSGRLPAVYPNFGYGNRRAENGGSQLSPVTINPNTIHHDE
jgi:hypothetical protein